MYLDLTKLIKIVIAFIIFTIVYFYGAFNITWINSVNASMIYFTFLGLMAFYFKENPIKINKQEYYEALYSEYRNALSQLAIYKSIANKEKHDYEMTGSFFSKETYNGTVIIVERFERKVDKMYTELHRLGFNPESSDSHKKRVGLYTVNTSRGKSKGKNKNQEKRKNKLTTNDLNDDGELKEDIEIDNDNDFIDDDNLDYLD